MRYEVRSKTTMKDRWIIGIIAMIALIGAVSAAGIVISVNGQTVGAGGKALIPVKVAGASDLGGVDLTVTYTEPGIRGNTATNTLKNGTVETGANVRIPLFIETGEKIRVDTRTGVYSERVK